MTTIHADKPGLLPSGRPYHETYQHAPHYRSKEEEFDALFTEVGLVDVKAFRLQH